MRAASEARKTTTGATSPGSIQGTPSGVLAVNWSFKAPISWNALSSACCDAILAFKTSIRATKRRFTMKRTNNANAKAPSSRAPNRNHAVSHHAARTVNASEAVAGSHGPPASAAATSKR